MYSQEYIDKFNDDIERMHKEKKVNSYTTEQQNLIGNLAKIRRMLKSDIPCEEKLKLIQESRILCSTCNHEFEERVGFKIPWHDAVYVNPSMYFFERCKICGFSNTLDI